MLLLNASIGCVQYNTDTVMQEKESDKFLVVFLCARRHNIPDTVKLLDKFIKKRKELGFDVNPPTIKDDALKRHFETGMFFSCFMIKGKCVTIGV
jgi:hypothetical protein